jgi:TolB-like protein
MNTPLRNSIYRFAAFEINLCAGELRKGGLKLHLPEQSFQILALLLEDAGQLVSRDEMKRHLWPAGTYVDFNHGVNKAMNRLRVVLGDSPTHPRFIETVARRGYRLIAHVSTTEYSRAVWSSSKSRLAVLPFVTMGRDHNSFTDGFTEELIAQLGRMDTQRLGVIARTSTKVYQGCQKRIDEIARELNVDYVLEGSVRCARRRVRITAQLIEVAGQTHRWANTYERELGDLFAVQAELSRIISHNLAFELFPDPQQHRTLVQAEFHKLISTLEAEVAVDPARRPI